MKFTKNRESGHEFMSSITHIDDGVAAVQIGGRIIPLLAVFIGCSRKYPTGLSGARCRRGRFAKIVCGVPGMAFVVLPPSDAALPLHNHNVTCVCVTVCCGDGGTLCVCNGNGS